MEWVPSSNGTLSIMNKRKLVRAIRIVWDSIDTHLDPAIDKRITGKVIGNRKFHKKTIEEYLEVINTLIELL